eukprot:1161305-Pelagomonas_calceolata.AAC.8
MLLALKFLFCWTTPLVLVACRAAEQHAQPSRLQCVPALGEQAVLVGAFSGTVFLMVASGALVIAISGVTTEELNRLQMMSLGVRLRS